MTTWIVYARRFNGGSPGWFATGRAQLDQTPEVGTTIQVNNDQCTVLWTDEFEHDVGVLFSSRHAAGEDDVIGRHIRAVGMLGSETTTVVLGGLELLVVIWQEDSWFRLGAETMLNGIINTDRYDSSVRDRARQILTTELPRWT